MEEAKEARRRCTDCKKNLCIGDGVQWMCWDCQHNKYNTNKEWI